MIIKSRQAAREQLKAVGNLNSVASKKKMRALLGDLIDTVFNEEDPPAEEKKETGGEPDPDSSQQKPAADPAPGNGEGAAVVVGADASLSALDDDEE